MAPCTLTGRNGHVQGSCYYWQIQAAVNTSGASKPPPQVGAGLPAAEDAGRYQMLPEAGALASCMAWTSQMKFLSLVPGLSSPLEQDPRE